MNREKQMFNDLVEIFAEEHESRGMITPHNTAKRMTEKGYTKQSEVAKEIITEIANCCRGDGNADIYYAMGYLTAMNKVLRKLAELKKKYTEG